MKSPLSNACQRHTVIKLNILLVAFVASFFGNEFKASAQANKESLDSAIESKYKEIQTELKPAGNHPWAGNYRRLGVDEVDVICIAPSGKIVALSEFQGPRFENCGIAKATGQELQITWDHDRLTLLGVQVHFLVVPWGNATFLIPRGEIHAFCLAYRETYARPMAERHNYIRVDGEVILEGAPKLPDEFKLFWDLSLIKAQITSISKVPRRKSDNVAARTLTCAINKGSVDHIFVGMQLYARDKQSLWEFTVTAVDEKSATMETKVRNTSRSPRVGIDVTSN